MNAKVEKKLDNLDYQLSKLLKEISSHTHRELNRKPSENSWSALQTMHHLMLAEKGAQMYLQKKLSFEPELGKAGIKAQLRSFALKSYLRSPFKMKAPPAISGESLPEESSFWETAKNWKSQRAELRSFLNTLPSELFDKEAFKHPFAGRMSINNMLSFFDAHFSNHRKQIKKALA